jgi:two-component system sensor histidine kinase RegB
MPFLKSDPDLGEEVTEMQTQVQRCKTIVSGILMSAGETRGESSGETTVCEFFDELISEWQSTRKVQEFSFQNLVGEDVDIASDTVLKQTICNLLDNALEASPEWVGLEVLRQNDKLFIRIIDRGPGFSSEILERLGQPYQSTKGRSGSGLGLFFVFNVARILGGEVEAWNRQEGGAEINLCLPLDVLRLKEA